MRRMLCRAVRDARQSLRPAARGQATEAAFLPTAQSFLPASQKADARLHGSEGERYRAASTAPSSAQDRKAAIRKTPSSRQAGRGKPAANQFQEDAFESRNITLWSAFV